jgi:hypothetical protein
MQIIKLTNNTIHPASKTEADFNRFVSELEKLSNLKLDSRQGFPRASDRLLRCLGTGDSSTHECIVCGSRIFREPGGHDRTGMGRW